MSPRNALHVGPCHFVTGRRRYRIAPDVQIPWTTPGDPSLPPLQVASDSDFDSVDDDQISQNDQEDQADETSQDDQDDQDDQNDHLAPNIPGGGLNVGGPPEIGPELDDGEVDNQGGQGDEGDEDDNDGFGEHGVPLIAEYRINLTALSQRYNMYAVAYRNVIHISRVRSCVDNALPARPDLVLRPPITPEALRVGGYINHSMPHQMNHLIMGDLGDEEILLLACDDGDVIGYYNFLIEKALSRLEFGDALKKSTPVEPFFHRNVGISAWGLAVHKKSRLIAVGNNHHEVHVFALALRNWPCATLERDAEPLYEPDLFPRLQRGPEGTMVSTSKTLTTKINLNTRKPLSRQREHGYCIVLSTGDRGSNIPNVAFANDADGDAVKALAIDISGKLWVLDIWSLHPIPHQCVENLYKAHLKSQLSQLPAHPVPLFLPRGWGVLVLPQSSFLPTSTFQDSLGLSPKEAAYVQNDEYGYYLGTEKAVKHIRNNSLIHPRVRENRLNWFEVAPDWQEFESMEKWYDRKRDCKKGWTSAQDKATDNSSEHVSPSLRNNNGGSNIIILPDGSSVMRTYAMDIELVGSALNVGIMFSNVIFQKKPQRTLPPNIQFPPERLANLLHVPELSLVVAGSLCGRVALITLTRPVNPHYSFKRGFKVEAILPKKIDEDRQLRPFCLLLGVAIGPILPAGGGMNRSLGELRYRIMLHYYDHTILSYEVYRNAVTKELFVI